MIYIPFSFFSFSYYFLNSNLYYTVTTYIYVLYIIIYVYMLDMGNMNGLDYILNWIKSLKVTQ